VLTKRIRVAARRSPTFKTVPDVPSSTFETDLPDGKYSSLRATLPARPTAASAAGTSRCPHHVGIVVKHRAGCGSAHHGRCNCRKVYQAAVRSARDHTRIRKHFDSLAAANSWRAETYGQRHRREMRAPSAMTLGEAAALWIVPTRGLGQESLGRPTSPARSAPTSSAAGPQGGRGALLRATGTVRLANL
jgi:hypothetical protein